MISGLDNLVFLEPLKHQYFHRETGDQYISGSKFLSNFREPFDKNIAYSCAGKGDYVGMSPEQVLAQWETYGKERAGLGTNIHEAMELFSETTQIKPENEYLRPSLLTINAQYSGYYRCLNEVVLHDDENLIAGTSDRVLIHTSHKDSVLSIADYKTNLGGLKQIDLDKKGKEKIKYLKGPLSHIIDSKYNFYCLQLSLYSYMLQKQTGRRIGKLFIHYINPENPLDNYQIPVANMYYEILECIKWYKSNAIVIEKPVTEVKSAINNWGNKEWDM